MKQIPSRKLRVLKPKKVSSIVLGSTNLSTEGAPYHFEFHVESHHAWRKRVATQLRCLASETPTCLDFAFLERMEMWVLVRDEGVDG